MRPHILVSVENVTPALLENLAAQGIGIELSNFANPHLLDSGDLGNAIAQHKEMLRGFPLPITMHGAFYDLNPAARDPKIVEVCYSRCFQSLEIAQQLDIHKVVFHTNYVHSNHTDYKERWTEKQVAFWEKLLPSLEQSGTTIYLENTREENASYIKGIIDGINNPHVSICYDTGHSHCFTDSKIRPVEWVNAYQHRLGYVHLHSNHGRFDEHIAFSKGSVDFDGFFEAFKSLSPMPYLIIEVKKREDFLVSVEDLKGIFG